MKPSIHSTHTSPGNCLRAMLAFAIMGACIMAPRVAHGQETDPAASPDATPASSGESSELTSTPSRYISIDQRPTYIASMANSFNIVGRDTDPFGQVQDPTAKPKVIKPSTLTQRRPSNFKPTSFSDIISRIQVNTIKPTDKKFFIGAREFKLGDEFPIDYRGRKVDVKVVGVAADQIDFEKTESGEVASVRLKLLPPGMSAGADGITAPGMVTDDAAAPLQIETSSGL